MECEVREKKWGNKGGKGRERVKGRNSERRERGCVKKEELG